MSRKLWLILLLVVVAVPIAALTTLPQEDDIPSPTLDITGVDPSALPEAQIIVNIFDQFGQHIPDLTAADFTLSGDLIDVAEIISVENITDDTLPIAVTLVIDTSTSMSGRPLAEAKAAARLFVESLDESDSVAIVAFSTNVRLIQDFTSDKTVLVNAIEALAVGGQTALYDASADAVRLIENAPAERRTIVFLSDGAEYGGIADTGQVALASDTPREEALRLAQVGSVPFYTIGLGYGTDRTYLQEVADLTNARFYESPTPEELSAIYAEIADLLRTQYIITLQADLPLDGTEYTVALQAQTPNGQTNIDEATLRAPIPVPIIQAPPPLSAPLSEETLLSFTIQADDRPLDVTLEASDDLVTTLDDTIFNITITPRELTPGTRTLTLTATDADGDSTTLNYDVEIASLPSTFTVNGLDDGAVLEAPFDVPLTLGVDVTYSQTPVTQVIYAVNNVEVANSDDPAASVEIPVDFDSGEQTLSITLLTESGQRDTVESRFIVRNYPAPVVMLRDTPPETITEPITLAFDIQADDTPLSDRLPTFSRDPLRDYNAQGEFLDDGTYTVTVDPRMLNSGENTMTIDISDSDGDTTFYDVNLNIGAFPPEFNVIGIMPGQTFSDSFSPDDFLTVDIEPTYIQDPIAEVSYAVNGTPITTRTAAPYGVDLPWLQTFSGSGEQTISVTVTSSNGTSTTQDITVTLTVIPTMTPTATPSATPTLTPTPNINATVQAQQPAIDSALNNIFAIADNQATATRQAELQETASALETTEAVNRVNAEASATAFVMSATERSAATDDAQNRANNNATATRQAVQTNQAASLANAQASSTAFIATRQAEQTADANATLAAEQEIAAQEQLDAGATIAAAATTDAAATADSMMTQTAEVAATTNAAATTAAQQQANFDATADAINATVAAQQTLDAQNAQATDAAADATAAAETTAIAQANVQATTDTELTLAAQQTATANAQATSVEQATREAQATISAGETSEAAQTLEAEAAVAAQQTLDAQNAQATDAAADATAAAETTAIAQANVQATTDTELTLAAQQTATANAQATSVEQATREAQATISVGETSEAAQTLEAEATAEATAAAIAQATTNAQSTQDAEAQATLDAEATLTAQPSATPQPSITPIGELTEIETGADDSGGDDITSLIIIAGIILLLLILLFLILGRRREPEEDIFQRG
jgi:VWFA-related protein